MSYRTTQAMCIFVAYSVFVFLEDVEHHRILYQVAIVGISILCLRQSVYLNNMYLLAYKMADYEKTMIQNMGQELYSEHYGKPVEILVNPRIGILGLNLELADRNKSDPRKWNTIIYNVLYRRIFKQEILSRRIPETFYYSTIFMYRERPEKLAKWFSECGYPIELYSGERIYGMISC